MPESILFIQTGGTIDKEYPHQSAGYAFTIGESAAEKLMQRMELSIDCQFVSCAQKDSMDLTDHDRDILVREIIQSSISQIIVTHGTDTMIETGTYLRTKIRDKTVIITGAMRPAAFQISDADFNIGAAVSACQTLGAGIYISMHGIIKEVSDVKRDLETGKYY